MGASASVSRMMIREGQDTVGLSQAMTLATLARLGQEVDMKALLVGDSEDMRARIPLCLRSKWRDTIIIQVPTALEALAAVKGEAPDLVLTDFTLYDMSATDMIEKVREFSEVPLVVITGDRSETDRAMVLEAGSDDCIVSTANIGEVLSRLAALFRRINRERLPLGQSQ